MIRNWREKLDILLHLPLTALAFLWRTLMVRTTFLAVTGSVGKTAAKDCLAAILADLGPTVKTEGSSNGRRGIPRTILKVRPWHRFAVIEAGTDRPGYMVRSSLLVRPDVVLILAVARTHTNEFKTLDAIAAEKKMILRFLRPGGTAVLNGDDPRVAEMAGATAGKVLLFGRSAGCAVRAGEATAIWPRRLEFIARAGGETLAIRTQLVGTHWVNSVLGAIAVAHSLGATLSQAAQAIKDLPPYLGRMQPVNLPNGAVLLRDEFNGSIDTFERSIEVLRQAQAARKILVMSDCSDFRKKPKERQKYFGRIAAQHADVVVFVGERGSYGVQYALRAGMPPAGAHSFCSIEDAARFLRLELRPGDLVLLRGRGSDHLTRLYFSLIGSVACHRSKCSIRHVCDLCPKLGFQPDPVINVVVPCAE